MDIARLACTRVARNLLMLATVAKSVRDLQVWNCAEELARAVFAASTRKQFLQHPRLREQLNDAAASILANIAEGFGQGTDKSFARFLTIARGSCNEVRSHLAVAIIRQCIPADVGSTLDVKADEVNRMLTGFERYLRASDRKVRF